MASRRIKGLDGLRAIAVLAVMAHHSGWPWAKGGWVGVDIFFAISGYLITGQLLHPEWTMAGFMWRRISRLWPALLVLCAFIAVMASTQSSDTLPILAAVTYTYSPVQLTGYAVKDNYLWHTWSLAVEMQFYVAWGMLLLRARTWPARRLLVWCTVLGCASAALAAALTAAGHAHIAYYGAPSHAVGLLAGSGLAVVGSIGRWSRPLIVILGVALLGAMPFVSGEAAVGLLVLGPVAVLFALAVISEVSTRGGVTVRVLDARIPRWVGLRSYSLYLWHVPLFALIDHHLALSGAPNVAVQWMATFVVAWASYGLVEVPCRRWLNSHSPHRFSGLRSYPA